MQAKYFGSILFFSWLFFQLFTFPLLAQWTNDSGLKIVSPKSRTCGCLFLSSSLPCQQVTATTIFLLCAFLSKWSVSFSFQFDLFHDNKTFPMKYKSPIFSLTFYFWSQFQVLCHFLPLEAPHSALSESSRLITVILIFICIDSNL